MVARLTVATPRRESQEQERRDTANLLHAPSLGLAKQIGGELAVSSSRVRKMTNAEAANPLEILAKWIRRLEREGAPAAEIDAIVAYLADLRAKDLAPRAATGASLAAADQVAGDGIAAAGRAMAGLVETFLDGRLTEEERRDNEQRIRAAIASFHRALDMNRRATTSAA